MPLHFVVDGDTALDGDEVVLTGREAHHAAVVRRVRVGEAVTVGDGRFEPWSDIFFLDCVPLGPCFFFGHLARLYCGLEPLANRLEMTFYPMVLFTVS